jgi:unsaturated rhamnogalacturonyl hydrolase
VKAGADPAPGPREASPSSYDVPSSRLQALAQTLVRHAYAPWSFGDSIGFEALLEYGRRVEPMVSGFVHGYLRGWAARRRPFVRLDSTAPGLALVQCYRDTGDEALLLAALQLADYLTGRPTTDGVFETWEASPLQRPYGPTRMTARDVALLTDPPAGVFVDCLHFDPPFFAALGATVGDEAWLELAVSQTQGYVRLLQQPSGLFDHFVLRGVAGSFGSAWGRGQGWAALGLLDVLARLDPSDVRRVPLEESVRAVLEAMAHLQRDDGHWGAVVDSPDCVAETSAAAFMALAAHRAAGLGLSLRPAAEAEALPAMRRRAIGAVRRDLRADGVLPGVSAAVNACTVQEHYEHVPTGFVVPWGQGPALLAMLECADGHRVREGAG